jgi:hypothetical protein
LGFETWKFLSPAAKREVILSAERGLHRQPQNIMRIVLAYDTWPEVCEASNALPGVDLTRLRELCVNESLAH